MAKKQIEPQDGQEANDKAQDLRGPDEGHVTPTRPAADEPAEAKEAMLEALASNECWGIVGAAIQELTNQGWIITRRLHVQWMKADKAYATEVNDLVKIGLEAQADAVRMNILVQMADDPGVAKFLATYMCGIGAKDGKPADTKDTPAKDPLDGLSTAQLAKMLADLEGKGPKGPKVA